MFTEQGLTHMLNDIVDWADVEMSIDNAIHYAINDIKDGRAPREYSPEVYDAIKAAAKLILDEDLKRPK